MYICICIYIYIHMYICVDGCDGLYRDTEGRGWTRMETHTEKDMESAMTTETRVWPGTFK